MFNFSNLYLKKKTRQCNNLNEKWKELWEKAIYISIVTNSLYNNALNIYLVNEDIIELEKFSRELFSFLPKGKYGIFSTVLYLIHEYDSFNKMETFLSNPDWNNLINCLQELVLKKMPPMYYFIDSMDDAYDEMPQYWQLCQKGAFFAIMDILREPVLREKMHIVLGIRDTIFMAIAQSEHVTKINYESHIFNLNWYKKSLNYFVCEKIKRLDDCYFFDTENLSSSNKNIKTWFNKEEIYSSFFDKKIKILDFILDMVRPTPRDIVVVCNELATLRSKVAEDENLDFDKTFNDIINSVASTIGQEIMSICSRQMRIETMPKTAGISTYSDYYLEPVGNEEDEFSSIENLAANDPYYKDLLKILCNVKEMRLSKDVLESIEKNGSSIIPTKIPILDILWQNRAIGLFIDNQMIYYMQNGYDNRSFPDTKENVFISPAVLLNIYKERGIK